MYFFTLASSSKGNCALVCSGDTKLLIDAGLSAARLEKALQAVGERPENLEPLPFSIVRGEDIYAPENQKLLFPVMSSSGR